MDSDLHWTRGREALAAVFQTAERCVYRSPHPKTIEQLVYKDNNKACYKYNVHEVDCDEGSV
jgi:hypothetical protein